MAVAVALAVATAGTGAALDRAKYAPAAMPPTRTGTIRRSSTSDDRDRGGGACDIVSEAVETCPSAVVGADSGLGGIRGKLGALGKSPLVLASTRRSSSPFPGTLDALSMSATIFFRLSIDSARYRSSTFATSRAGAGPTTRSIAAAMSSAVAKRSPGERESALSTIASSSFGTRGFRVLGGGISIVTMRFMICASVSPLNRRSPASASHNTTPAA